MVALAESVFPDDTNLQWIIRRFDHDGHLTHVEAVRCPDRSATRA